MAGETGVARAGATDRTALHHGAPPGRRRRAGLAAAVTLLAYAGAVGGALLTGLGGASLTGGVEVAAGRSATWLDGLAIALPLGYAFGAGMVAAVNPCGFALLPTYLGLYLGDAGATGDRGAAGRLRRTAAVSAAVTASFVALFGVAGLALAAASAALAGALPWVGLAVGAALVLAGGLLLGGAEFSAGPGERLAGRLGGRARAGGLGGYLAYGLAYGLASLSCTLPIFLTVVGGALTAEGLAAAAGQLVLYALGMGAVIAVLTLATALFKHAVLRGVRRALPYVEPVSAVLLLLAGAYIIYYWLTIGGLAR